VKIRPALLLVPALLLAGCNSDGNSDYSNYFKLLKTGFSGDFKATNVSREQAAAVPYASMGVKVNGGNEGLLILATQTGNDLLWTSSSHIVVVTNQGRVTRTVGLPQDITAAIQQDTSLAMAPVAAALRGPFDSTRVIDFPGEGAFNLRLQCHATSAGLRQISVLGQALKVIRVDDKCRVVETGWSFTDNYWIDKDNGMVWRSLQHIHPNGETLRLQILRPPG
jgi:Group 4 capsule polysaccharide lipoprotein gfcB, YjbF